MKRKWGETLAWIGIFGIFIVSTVGICTYCIWDTPSAFKIR